MPLKQTADGNLLGNILLFLLNNEGKLFVRQSIESIFFSRAVLSIGLAVSHANSPS